MFPPQFIIRFLTWMPFPSSNIDFFEYMMKRLLLPLYCTLSSLGNCLANVNSNLTDIINLAHAVPPYLSTFWVIDLVVGRLSILNLTLCEEFSISHIFFRNMMTSFCWVFTPRCCSSCDFFVPIHPWRDMSQPSLRPLGNCGLHSVFFSWPKTAL